MRPSAVRLEGCLAGDPSAPGSESIEGWYDDTRRPLGELIPFALAPPPGNNGIRFEKSRSAPLKVFYNPLIDWDLFLFFGVFKKRGYVATFFLANYAVWNCFGRKVDGFENRGSEVDQILWQATDPPSDFGHSEDGGAVSVLESR